MPRCFVGCFLDAESAGELSRCCPDPAGLRRTAPENYHVTLLFAGQIEEDAARTLAALVGALDGVGTVAGVVRIGGFPAGRSARILAADLEPDPRLLDWHRTLQGAWPAARESRPFRAHVTLARGRRAVRLPEIAQPGFDVALGPPALFESLTLPAGARYRLLAY